MSAADRKAGRRAAAAAGRTLDWTAVHRRLEVARAAVERIGAPPPEEARRILQERARLLASEPLTESDVERIEVLGFRLAAEHYAVETRLVREVAPLENLTTLPCTPAFVLGIVNLRGEILSVLDLRRFFDLPVRGLTDLNKVIVLETGEMRLGVLADAITGVHDLPADRIQPSLPTLTGIRAEYLKGVTPERVVILDAARLLADENLIVREQVAG